MLPYQKMRKMERYNQAFDLLTEDYSILHNLIQP